MPVSIQPPLPPSLPATRQHTFACEAQAPVQDGVLSGRIVVAPSNSLKQQTFTWTPGEQQGQAKFAVVTSQSAGRAASKSLVVTFSVPASENGRLAKGQPSAKLWLATGEHNTKIAPLPAAPGVTHTVAATFKISNGELAGQVRAELRDGTGAPVVTGTIDGAALNLPAQAEQANPLSAFPAATWQCAPASLK
ncbi:hypothetical protein [Caulobacter sp. 1776]|uniref:hypothetical protein n=1 Tax=Caulobacter sp. 1776 TaxID=3156420 RepID=UPI00339B0F97